jgi:transmembrane sensor
VYFSLGLSWLYKEKNMSEKDQIEKNTTEYNEARLEETLDIFVQMRAVDKAKGYRRIVEPVNCGARHRRFILLSRYAAVIAVIVVVGIIWGVRGRVDRAIPVMQTREITPGGMKAKLILATGKNVLLDTLALEVTTIWEAGATIQKSGGVLTYENVGKEDARPMEVVYNTLEVPRGGEYDVVLEDGTRVWLNADSRLKYPVVFPGSERRVILEGEAYFEVARDTNRPFLVETGVQSLRVLGTAFNVYAYPDEPDIYTTLVYGSVALSAGGQRHERVLVPGEQAVYHVRNGNFTVGKVDVSQVAAWKKGLFVFENQNLEQIMLKLARWYNVMVFFRNEAARTIEFKGNLPKYSDFRLVLQVIEKSSNVKFDVKGETVIVSI